MFWPSLIDGAGLAAGAGIIGSLRENGGGSMKKRRRHNPGPVDSRPLAVRMGYGPNVSGVAIDRDAINQYTQARLNPAKWLRYSDPVLSRSYALMWLERAKEDGWPAPVVRTIKRGTTVKYAVYVQEGTNMRSNPGEIMYPNVTEITQARLNPSGMDTGARELLLFINNDANLYHQMFLPIVRNLMQKRAKGTYSSARAVTAFMYLADEGAKRYNKEFGDGTASMKLFPIAERRQVATALRDDFETEANLGNYDAELRHRSNPLLVGHRDDDPDAVGSALANAQHTPVPADYTAFLGGPGAGVVSQRYPFVGANAPFTGPSISTGDGQGGGGQILANPGGHTTWNSFVKAWMHRARPESPAEAREAMRAAGNAWRQRRHRSNPLESYDQYRAAWQRSMPKLTPEQRAAVRREQEAMRREQEAMRKEWAEVERHRSNPDTGLGIIPGSGPGGGGLRLNPGGHIWHLASDWNTGRLHHQVVAKLNAKGETTYAVELVDGHPVSETGGSHPSWARAAAAWARKHHHNPVVEGEIVRIPALDTTATIKEIIDGGFLGGTKYRVQEESGKSAIVPKRAVKTLGNPHGHHVERCPKCRRNIEVPNHMRSGRCPHCRAHVAVA